MEQDEKRKTCNILSDIEELRKSFPKTRLHTLGIMLKTETETLFPCPHKRRSKQVTPPARINESEAHANGPSSVKQRQNQIHNPTPQQTRDFRSSRWAFASFSALNSARSDASSRRYPSIALTCLVGALKPVLLAFLVHNVQLGQVRNKTGHVVIVLVGGGGGRRGVGIARWWEEEEGEGKKKGP